MYPLCIAKDIIKLDYMMDQQGDSYQQEDIWGTFTELPFSMSAVTTAPTYAPITWPLAPQTVEIDPSLFLSDLNDNLDQYAIYDTPLPKPHLELQEQSQTPQYIPLEGVSPGSVSESGLSTGSYHDGSRRLSSNAATTPRIVTKEDLEQGKHLSLPVYQS